MTMFLQSDFEVERVSFEWLEPLDVLSCFRAVSRDQNLVRTEGFGIKSCVTLKKMEG